MTVSTTQLTPLSFLERAARVHADRTAVVHGERRLTYMDLHDAVVTMTRALRASGVEPGDRVAFLMPNLPEMLMAHYAVPLAGAVLVSINTRLSKGEVAYILAHSRSKLIVADSTLADTAVEAAGRVQTCEEVVTFVDVQAPAASGVDVPDVADGSTDFVEFLARAEQFDDDLPFDIADEFAPITVNYTSGTTGKPKGVVYSHRGAHLNALAEVIHSRHTTESVYLWTLPMFHCNGWCTTWGITAIGGTHVCLREVRGDVIWRLIEQEGVTHLNGAPTVLTTIASSPAAGELERPVIITTAGAPPAPATIERMEAKGFEIIHVYGLTETYGPYAVREARAEWRDLPARERAVLQARQGYAMVHADPIRVVDSAMNDVPVDGVSMGEIVMRGNGVMLGYLDDPEGTDLAFEGGWFHSGDLGVMHPDGSIELRDRAKDVVVSGGENISTIEVEQALMSHDDVVEVAVIGVPDERWGERPKGFVVVTPDSTVTGDELVAHVQEQIARYKAPREVVIVEELPKTSTGKIQKFELRELEWGEHAGRIQG